MTTERGKRWLFDEKEFLHYYERGHRYDLMDFIDSEIERNRKEAVRDFAEKVKVKSLNHPMNQRIEAALKELDKP